MYVTDNNSWMPPTDYSAQHIGYINNYFNVKSDYWNKATAAIANRKPSGAYFYCPALYGSAKESPLNPATVADYYFSNYVATVHEVVADANVRAGCWIIGIPGNSRYPYRKLDFITDGTVILGEGNYGGLSGSGIFNQCAALHYNYRNTLLDANAPAWNLHTRSANFLFKDGHVKVYKWTGANLFSTEYMPLK